MILTGKVEPGEFLPRCKELAERFDAGLPTVHEVRPVIEIALAEMAARRARPD